MTHPVPAHCFHLVCLYGNLTSCCPYCECPSPTVLSCTLSADDLRLVCALRCVIQFLIDLVIFTFALFPFLLHLTEVFLMLALVGSVLRKLSMLSFLYLSSFFPVPNLLQGDVPLVAFVRLVPYVLFHPIWHCYLCSYVVFVAYAHSLSVHSLLPLLATTVVLQSLAVSVLVLSFSVPFRPLLSPSVASLFVYDDSSLLCLVFLRDAVH